jgi:hypothetical protein
MKYSENKEHAITIAWDTSEGKRRLFESRFNKDFFELAHRFQPQMKPTYCGVASAVSVLNALRLKTGLRIDSGLEVHAPASHGGTTMHYNSYSQLTFLNQQTDLVKPREWVEGITVECETTGDVIFEPGLNLEELARKLKLYLLSAQVKHAVLNKEPRSSKDNPVTRFRHDLMAYLNDKSTFIIVNYLGREIGKNVGGHFSPVAAYHRETDSCLVMDVAGHKHPWFWVTLKDLYYAMATKDGEDTRGYMLISDKLRH